MKSQVFTFLFGEVVAGVSIFYRYRIHRSVAEVCYEIPFIGMALTRPLPRKLTEIRKEAEECVELYFRIFDRANEYKVRRGRERHA